MAGVLSSDRDRLLREGLWNAGLHDFAEAVCAPDEEQEAIPALAFADPRAAAADPVGWMRVVVGAGLWEKQAEIAEAVRDYKRVAVKSCYGTGKDYIAAHIAVWWLHAYPSSIVLTTATSGNQVENILWRYIRAIYARDALGMLRGRCLTKQIDVAPDWYALGFKAADTDATRWQGFHAERVLVIKDEAGGLPDSVHDALDGALASASAHELMIGNPTSGTGRFYDAFHGARERYHTISIAWEDTPNARAEQTVRPYLITQSWVDDAVAQHGDDSPYVQARVHASFPDAGDNASLIPLSQIEEALEREHVPLPADEWVAALDVARFGDDENALCIRHGRLLVHEESWSGLDLMQTVGKLRHVLGQYPAMVRIVIDSIGLGAGVLDRMRELREPVVAFDAGGKSSNAGKYINLRCEGWWSLREQFREGLIAGRFANVTVGQLASIRYSYDSSHTAPVIEPKEQAKRRGVKSPDRGDAVMMCFASVGYPSGHWSEAEHMISDNDWRARRP